MAKPAEKRGQINRARLDATNEEEIRRQIAEDPDTAPEITQPDINRLRVVRPSRKQRTPQEKKIKSYQKDCRNDYGENDKSSRKAIRTRKAMVNRNYRRKVKEALQYGAEHGTGEDGTEVIRPDWKKVPDLPLADFMERKQSSQKDPEADKRSLRAEARKRLRKSGVQIDG